MARRPAKGEKRHKRPEERAPQVKATPGTPAPPARVYHVVSGLFAPEHHKALIEAFELRQLANYSPGVAVGEPRARRLVDQAAAFVRDAEAHIRAQSG